MAAQRGLPRLTAEEAALLIKDGATVGFSGFTPSGTPKAVPHAVAQRARLEHAAGRNFRIGVVTGASTGPSLDGALSHADAIAFRTPYQSDAHLRQRINEGTTKFFDMHLSTVPQNLRYGFLGEIDCAVIEACSLRENGEIVLTGAVGIAPTLCRVAKKIIIELNRHHPRELLGFHDIYEPLDPPYRRAIPIYHASDRIGDPVIRVNPSKIAGVVETDLPNDPIWFEPSNPKTDRIGQNVAQFLAQERRAGRLPADFLPLQSGVGDIANAVLSSLGNHPEIPPFEMYTEVIQDAVVQLIRDGRIAFASGCSLTLSPNRLASVYENLDFFRGKILLRPQEISNQPEVIRRLGIISVNTAIEVDIFGNVNSTHILGKSMMNGIGGSGDFTRNAFLSIFTCCSTVAGGKISTIVPLVSHCDHSEHSVQVLVTEQGVADLRGKDPYERAIAIIENCAHPDFRDQLRSYFRASKGGHTPHTLATAFSMHENFLQTGDMRKAKADD
ncbi:MAG TPA: acetyl-CoA hydrolase/transferase family protein [Opitutaceae bacterium]|nr:acetyl-CoA hydrolase/transferase family protein [Opitutaceae bacterium]